MSAQVRQFGCNLCEAMCGLDVTVDGGRITDLRGDPLDGFSHGHICPKAFGLKELYEDPARLRQPVRRMCSDFVPVSWDEALDEAAAKLKAIQRAHGRDAVAYYFGNPSAHSHRASLGALLLTLALRSKNTFSANSQDSNPRLFACLQLYGDPLSVPVPDIDRTELLVMLGANPLVSHGSLWGLGDPRGVLTAVKKRGGALVLVDPRRNETAALCDEHHFIRPGGDAALLLAMLNVVFSEGLVDVHDVDAVAEGRLELEKAASAFTPERVAPAIGIEAPAIRALARRIARTRRAAVYGRLGTSVNELGPVASWLIDALNVVTGHFDRPGGVMFGQPATDLAPLSRLLLSSKHGRWRSRVRGLPEFLDSLPAAVMAEEMETPGEGQVRALVTFAGDPVLSVPNGPRLAKAIEKLEYRVAIDFYLSETARRADLVLPPLHVFETGNFDLLMYPFLRHNFVRYSEQLLPRPKDGLDNWEICLELAARLMLPSLARGAVKRLLRNAPDLLVDQLLQQNGLSLEELKGHPHGLDRGPLRPAREERVRRPNALVQLSPKVLMDEVPRVERWLKDASSAQLLLIGRRSMRSNNSWMHNLRGMVKGPDRSRLMMHPLDAAPRGITDDSRVRISSRAGSLEVKVHLSEDVARGVVSLPHGFGHRGSTLPVAGGLNAPSANDLTDETVVDPVLGTSVLNGVPVEVQPAPV